MKRLLLFLLVLSPVGLRADQPNVLFIAVDDLRPQLACYGEKAMHTPNIDQLASQATLFERAYCMVPTCGASRSSLFTGIRPTRTRFVTHLARVDREAAGITALHTHFQQHGYVTQSLGKILHFAEDSAAGWSQPAWRPQVGRSYFLEANQQLQQRRAKELGDKGRGPAWEAAPHPEEEYADGLLAAEAMKRLRQLKRGGKPFFLAVGFLKPHLPFVCPQKYWDLYDAGDIQLPATYHRPENAPDEAIHNSGELRSYAGIPKNGPVSDEQAKQLIHGYYACVSFTDAQIGKVLDELARLGLAENTIVVLWGDHGWNLGEHTLWCKHCCFETSMRIPLLIRAPGLPGGQRTAALTETIDLYPTLCELAGLKFPSHQLQGSSLVPLLRDPGLPGKQFAVGRFGAGDTIRTPDFRFTEYTTPRDQRQAVMLYDHRTDGAEDHNLSSFPTARSTVEKLTQQLREHRGKPLEELRGETP